MVALDDPDVVVNLDHEELLATAQAALAAPDHLVEVSIGKSLVA